MDTIAAVSTALSPGGLAVLRISGAESIKIASKIFRSSVNKSADGRNSYVPDLADSSIPEKGRELSEIPGYNAVYGRVYDYTDGMLLDEAVALIFRAPRSFTGENVVEISVHGGVYLANRVLRSILAAGARLAKPGEFTRRAFENGKMSLAQAESVMQIIGAENEQGIRAAASARQGALSVRMEKISDKLIKLAGAVAAYIDFPEEDIPELETEELLKALKFVSGELDRLIREYDTGRLLTEGIDTVIAGRPNVGKSALMNLLCGDERSIVTEIAGTTRDIIEQSVRLSDIILKLSDTAGIREGADIIETLGIERTRKRLDTAQLIIAVFDAGEPLAEDDRQLLELCGGRACVAVINKTDLPARKIDEEYIAARAPVVYLSAQTGDGLDCLEAEIARIFKLHSLDPGAGIILGQRQYSCIIRAKEAVNHALESVEAGMTPDIAGVCIDDALAALLEISGQNVSESVINEVFSKFCIGK